MTTAVSCLKRGEVHAGYSWTISLATGGERQLRHWRAPAPSRNELGLGGVAASRHLPRGSVSSQKEKRPSEKWHITNFALGSRARFRPLSKGGEGEAVLKAAAAPLPEQTQLPACSWRLGAGSREPGAGFDCRNLTQRRCSGYAPRPPGGYLSKRELWEKV